MAVNQQLAKRHLKSKIFAMFCGGVVLMSMVILAVLLIQVSIDGFAYLDAQFLQSFPSRFPEKAGIKSALVGTIWLISLTALISIPVGVSAAIYLEEYTRKGPISKFIELNINNLAGVPSIVYGILGLAVFVRFFGLERSLIAGALTMSLLILPVIIIASREAIKTVPDSQRQAAYALGATRWQTVSSHVLPGSASGILTGVILAVSRAIGETAPLLIIGALTYVAFLPEGIHDEFTALPIQIFNWASRPQAEFHNVASAAIIVLLLVLLCLNGIAIYIRQRAERNQIR